MSEREWGITATTVPTLLLPLWTNIPKEHEFDVAAFVGWAKDAPKLPENPNEDEKL